MSVNLKGCIIANTFQGLIKTCDAQCLPENDKIVLTDGVGEISSISIGRCGQGILIEGDSNIQGNNIISQDLTVQNNALIGERLSAGDIIYPKLDDQAFDYEGNPTQLDDNFIVRFDNNLKKLFFQELKQYNDQFIVPVRGIILYSLSANELLIDEANLDIPLNRLPAEIDNQSQIFIRRGNGLNGDEPLFQVCNGAPIFGVPGELTPDIRGKFVVGTGSYNDNSFSLDSIGGSSSTDTSTSITIGENNIPRHSHTFSVSKVFRGDSIKIESTNPSSGTQGTLSTPMSIRNRTFNEGRLHDGVWRSETVNGSSSSFGKTNPDPINIGSTIDFTPPFISLLYVMRVR